MVFEIEGKVALVTGAASGMGIEFAKTLLKNGLKGVTIADINEKEGSKVVEELQAKHGKGKAIFVKTDVTKDDSFEDAFKKTISVYKNLDILINNAGIANEHIWNKVVDINLKGVIRGTSLGMENYIFKHKSGPEGVVVNIASVAGFSTDYCGIPAYSATKFGVVGLSMTLGVEAHYKRTGVRVLALCPGLTNTPGIKAPETRVSKAYGTMLSDALAAFPPQEPQAVATGLVKVIQTAKSGTVWVVENAKDPYEYVLPPRESFAPKS